MTSRGVGGGGGCQRQGKGKDYVGLRDSTSSTPFSTYPAIKG